MFNFKKNYYLCWSIPKMKRIFSLLFILLLFGLQAIAQPMAAPSVRTIRVIDDTSVELCWPSAPPLNGNTFDEYQIFYSNSPNGPFNMVQTINVYLTTSTTITSLPVVNTSRYFYLVTRFNSNQLSTHSDTIQSINLNVIQGANGHMELSWNPIHTPAFPSTEGTYRVYRRILPAPGYTQLGNVSTPNYSDSLIYFPVCNETIYYRIDLGDQAAGCLSVSNEKESTFVNTIPDAPTLKTVTVTGAAPLQDVTLTWDISPSPDVKGYYVYQLNNTGSPVQVADVPGRLSITATLTSLEGSFPNTLSETYRVAAYDSCGNTGSPSLFHHTIFPKSKLETCDGTIEISWNKYTNWPQGVGAYEIYVSQNASPYSLLATVGPNDTTYTHLSLIQGTLYTYKIKAIDASGFLFSESSYTEIIADVPVRPAFLYFKYATVTGIRSAELMLYHDTTADITEYVIMRSENLGDTFDTLATIPFDPNNAFLVYEDTTNCLTYKKSYVYRAVAFNLCGQPVYNSDNIAKTIFLRAASELDMENTISWSDYENWNGNVRSYKVFRGFQGVFSDIPAATIPYGSNTYYDDIANRISKDGEYCYYVQAYQGLDTINFFADSSRSNKICVKQMKTFYMPNAFQPDGVNKIFKPASTFLNTNNYLFQIFTKWGERVFETTEPTTGWDGTINGNEARMDVYIYRITFQNENFETKEYRGTVTLLR